MVTYENTDWSWMSCPTYIRIPSFLIHRFTLFTIFGLILEITNHLNFIPIISEFRISLWVNETNQIIFWPVFIASLCFIVISIRHDRSLIPTKSSALLYFLIMSPLYILMLETVIYQVDVIMLIPQDFPQTVVNEQNFHNLVIEILTISFVIIPFFTVLTNHLKLQIFKSHEIRNNEYLKIDTEKFIPVVWMTFIVSLTYVFIHNFLNYH